MIITTDALIAELANNVDYCFVNPDSRLKSLSKGHRMWMILLALAELDLATIVKTKTNEVWWRPSLRLRQYAGVRGHGLPMQELFVESPKHDAKAATDFKSMLIRNAAEIEDGAFSLIRCFMMCKLGLLEHCTNENGPCEFRTTDRHLNVIDDNGVSHDFVDRYI